MLFLDGRAATPISYVWGSGIATVRTESGETISVEWTKLTSPQGEAYVAQVLRDVRTK